MYFLSAIAVLRESVLVCRSDVQFPWQPLGEKRRCSDVSVRAKSRVKAKAAQKAACWLWFKRTKHTHSVFVQNIIYTRTQLEKEVAATAEKEQNHFGLRPIQRGRTRSLCFYCILTGRGIEIRISHSLLLFYFRLVGLCAVCLPWRLSCVLHRPINQSGGLHVVGKCLISELIFCHRSCLLLSLSVSGSSTPLTLRFAPGQRRAARAAFWRRDGSLSCDLWCDRLSVAFCRASESWIIIPKHLAFLRGEADSADGISGPFNCSIMIAAFSSQWSHYFCNYFFIVTHELSKLCVWMLKCQVNTCLNVQFTSWNCNSKER